MAENNDHEEAGDRSSEADRGTGTRPLAEDVQGEGDQQSRGVPAAGMPDNSSFSPTGSPGIHHWKEGTISQAGLDQRGNVFFAAIEMTRMPMILTDPNLPDNPIVFANRAFQDLTGYEEAEIVGRNCRFLQGANTDRETVGEIRATVAARSALQTEILNYKRDGTPFWNALYLGPVFDREGKLLYFFASQLDITKRRTSEAAFRQAQKMEAIGQLTAGLAHDFNNLLQVITGNLELLEPQVRDEKSRRLVETASLAAERGSRLTRQLLAFARKTRLEPKAINLNSLIIEFGDMLNSTVGGSVDLRFNLKPRTPLCFIDPVHLEMALLNVVINARDAMPKGGTVTITTEPLQIGGDADAPAHHLPPGDYASLSVTDQGNGMPAHVAARATEPFFTTKEVGKGTGLGLAMVHGFVQQSMGKLEIDSELGSGTTVRMLFPAGRLAKEKTLERQVLPDARDVPKGDGPLPATKTVLAVEDSEDILMLAREYLTTLGYSVLTAGNADDALKLLSDDGIDIDLLFTDLIMPGSMNGMALAGEAQRIRPGLPVLFTTGYNEDLVTDGQRAAGMDLIGKPYRRTELADRINAALNRPKLRGDRSQGGGHKEG
ncbi:PAS domain S-box-containing protein [Skermanella aerolata]|uniref:histidine kinase famiy protein n=1 Tax=Skermanella aerolata TaxID=393310 RepID=UPI003D24E793